MTKISGLISIARKAGYVVIGQDNLSAHKQKLYLLLMCKSAGNSLVREMRHISNESQIPLLEVEELGKLIGIDNCKALGVKSKAFSDNIIKIIKEGE